LAAILAQVTYELEEMGDKLKPEDTDVIWHHVRTNLDEDNMQIIYMIVLELVCTFSKMKFTNYFVVKKEIS
jgi:hypothetical protein